MSHGLPLPSAVKFAIQCVYGWVARVATREVVVSGQKKRRSEMPAQSRLASASQPAMSLGCNGDPMQCKVVWMRSRIHRGRYQLGSENPCVLKRVARCDERSTMPVFCRCRGSPRGLVTHGQTLALFAPLPLHSLRHRLEAKEHVRGVSRSRRMPRLPEVVILIRATGDK